MWVHQRIGERQADCPNDQKRRIVTRISRHFAESYEVDSHVSR